MTEESNADAGRNRTSRETLGEDPVTGLNDFKTLMRDKLRFFPSSSGREAVEMETQAIEVNRAFPSQIHLL